MNREFYKELTASGYIHFPLPLHKERSLEAELEQKEILQSRQLWDETMKFPLHTGIGTLSLIQNAGRHGGAVIRAVGPNDRTSMPYEDGATKHFFESFTVFHFSNENWENFNRISLWIKPDSPGTYSPHVVLKLVNAGTRPVPDKYLREGQHQCNLENHAWNHVIWEFNALPRDSITSFSVEIEADGKDTATADNFLFDFEDIQLQKVLLPEKESGWLPAPGSICYSMSGYLPDGRKNAVANTGADFFSLHLESGEEVLAAPIRRVSLPQGAFEILDFSEIQKTGCYYLKAGDAVTAPFVIGPDALEDAAWKVLNFIFCERCGFPVPKKHGRCHIDVIAKHNGVTLSMGGGWHDAGDMSQQMLQTAEVVWALLEAASSVSSDELLSRRMMEEALWGLEYVLKSRLGDGFRASSVGLGLWTDGFIGNTDDVEYRVHNQAYQNFFCGAIEAQAAFVLREADPDLAWKCLDAAKQDYAFASRRFAEHGIEYPIMWEHTLCSGLSQYYAAIAYAAASICKSEPTEALRQDAIHYGNLLLACQEAGSGSVPMKGFFYRDPSHNAIVHFSHQGREHSFVQALEALCQAFPDAPEKKDWEKGLALYGEYLKSIYSYRVPYGMLPAGIYHISEIEDRETFDLIHLQVNYDEEKSNYEAQLKAGISLGNGYYLRMFPVWFSFRGNSAILLSMAKGASIVGTYFHDSGLLDMARQQLYWMSGLNPFAQSLIYGEGHRYSQQYAYYPGEMAGEMSVGIETPDNEDIPYLPGGNTATYKEVWLTTAGRWLSVLADLYPLPTCA